MWGDGAQRSCHRRLAGRQHEKYTRHPWSEVGHRPSGWWWVRRHSPHVSVNGGESVLRRSRTSAVFVIFGISRPHKRCMRRRLRKHHLRRPDIPRSGFSIRSLREPQFPSLFGAAEPPWLKTRVTCRTSLRSHSDWNAHDGRAHLDLLRRGKKAANFFARSFSRLVICQVGASFG